MNKIIFSLLFVFSTSSLATTYIISSTGNDNNNGTTITTPLKTISAGINKAVAGDIIQVRNGIYNEKINIWKSGTSSSPITIINYNNESPIIDGNNQTTGDWQNLITVTGNYIYIIGFEIRNMNLTGVKAGGYNVYVSGSNVKFSKCNIHDSWEQGVVFNGNYNILEYSKVSKSGLSVKPKVPGWPTMWPNGVIVAALHGSTSIPTGSVIQYNDIYENYGEGLDIMKASNVKVYKNTIHDNMAVNLYVDDSNDVLVDSNLVYATNISDQLFGIPARGLGISNEYTVNPKGLTNITIINNIVLGTAYPFVYFTGGGINQFKDSLIANNLFMNGRGGRGGGPNTIAFNGSGVSNVQFRNNIAIQEDSTPIFIGSTLGYILSNNIWSKSPGITLGSGDIIADPKISKTGTANTIAWFTPGTGSPAIDKALKLIQVPVDINGKTRSATPTIGPIEISSSTPVTPVTPSLSLNKIVTSSSDESTSLLAKNVVDGILNTRWSSQFSDPQWISIDLGAWYSLNKISLQWEAAAAKEYKIQGSIDNINWFDLYNVTNGIGGTEEYSINGVARYVKINGVKRITPYGYSLWEISIYGTIFSCK